MARYTISGRVSCCPQIQLLSAAAKSGRIAAVAAVTDPFPTFQASTLPCSTLQGRDADSAMDMQHALMETLLGTPRPAVMATMVVAAALALEAAAGAQGLGTAVAACICVAERAGQATWRRRVGRRARSALACRLRLETCRCLIYGLCWQS